MGALLFAVIGVLTTFVVCFIHVHHCQTVCSRQVSSEWHPKPNKIQMNWTLAENICLSFSECWGSQEADIFPSAKYPQLCPLHLQYGDTLIMLADESLKLYGIKIVKVSEPTFQGCATARKEDQLLFPHNLNESVKVEAKFLVPGQHYFIAIHDGDTQLCTLGLRINVTVKAHLCQASHLLRPCSGNGVCQTRLWESGYHCRCRHHYSGRFCEKFDVCLDNPCENKGVCLSNGTTDPNHKAYKCLCPPHFTGMNCSEIVGSENCERICENGSCVQVSPSSFRCICDIQTSGPPCRQRKHQCDPDPCRNGGTCVARPRGFVCLCPERYRGVLCESHFVPNCTSSTCRQEQPCTAGEQTPQCSNSRHNVCRPSPCRNNATCVSKAHDYLCGCLRGYSGKNCEEIIDYCGLLNISCLNEGLCLSVIGSYQCVCAPGWTGEFCQYAADACLINPNHCVNGATCITTNQPSSPPQFVCKCTHGFTGTYCETEINECESSPCQHNGTCSNLVGRYKCNCPTGFEGENCEVDIDACVLSESTCSPETECLDLPIGLQYMCRTLCPPSLKPCSNGGRCVLNDASSYTCVCTPGWSGQNCRINVNDCVQHWCQNGGTCVDEIDGYRCLCPKGHTGRNCEEDTDFCIGHGCSEHGVCVDGRYNFTCRCVPGYEGLLCELETDECHSSPCAAGATCVDLISDYQCHCPPGFQGRICSENVNDCWSQPCLNGGFCVDLINDYTCQCPLGFKGNDCSVDIDLCSFGICSEHTLMCTETRDGHSVSCLCERGFSGMFCDVNLNECDSKPCQNGGVCVDGTDLYRCLCPSGFGGLNCEIKFDECVFGYCANNSTCIDLAADYECICPPGYTGKNCTTAASGCAVDVEYCKNGATCLHNSLGEIHCICPTGYHGYDCSSSVNQCVSNPCDPEGTLHCEDLANTFRCVCQHGYTGPLCATPIDQCVDNLCQHGAACLDQSSGFKCFCSPGLTGRFCEKNIDDCKGNPCGSLSMCKDTVNGFVCFCAPGFVGTNCEIEVDECLSQPCQNDGSCIDELNSFSCLCPPGITGRWCEVNIDECISSPCWNNGSCIDLVLGYDCVCRLGYTGAKCEIDIDECDSSPCKNGATCIDQPSNYFCQCVAPFKGHNCEFLPCEATNPCENGAVCVEELDQDHFPLGFRCRCRRGFTGPRCEINVDECSSSPCLHGFCYDVVDGFYCLCNPGYVGPRCEQDIDDCVNNSCSGNSECRDLHQTYECVCHSGWEGKFCQQEIDECLSQPCKNNGTCTDLLNGYTCACEPGWTGVDCAENVNECESAPCLNGAQCQESHVPGEFLCTCPPFYIGPVCSQPYDPCDPLHNPCLHSSTCLTRSDGTAACMCTAGFEGGWCEIDTNECASNPCHHQGRCVDGVNGYRCQCKEGYSGLHCEQDINECASTPCQNGATCQDLENMFLCVCSPGYFGARCDLDVNECEVSPCLHQGICINKPGAFACVCHPGYSGARCEVNIDECASDPCQNSGRCIDGQNQYDCLCPDGFIGLNCETNIDECMSAPCLHGRCHDGPSVYSCLCDQGWTGLQCEQNIDDCAHHPCQNGGSCVDLIDKFACFCPDGFTGKTCENDMNVCKEAADNASLCFNGGTCLDGKGPNFTCSCPPGFTGDFCEVDFNECCSAPCHHGGICQDLINSYVCHCRSGWTGLHCEDDINECLPQPCDRGICIQNDPGYGYTCFCRPGFVGKNCEHNYDDCLSNPCPPAFFCVDGVNGVSCLPPAIDAVPLATNITSPQHRIPALSPAPTAPRSTANVQYFGNSLLEFDKIDLSAVINITMRFQTRSAQGTLLYMDQGLANNQFFFIKLFIMDGVLKYVFSCNEEDSVTLINTSVHVNNDEAHVVNIRQHLTPCEAELTLSGYGTTKSPASNYWFGYKLQSANHVYVGGLPLRYLISQKAAPFNNFTGCIEIIEINKQRSFYASDAVANHNTEECRKTINLSGSFPSSVVVPSSLKNEIVRPAPQTENPTSDGAPVCLDGLCQNGGTCFVQHHLNKPIPSCLCPLHFAGPFCDKDATVYIPRFDVDSYLELQPPASLLQSSGDSNNLPITDKDTTVILQLTLKTRSTQGTILYSQSQNFGEPSVHVFLEDGSPVVRLNCGNNHVLSVTADQRINTDRWVNLTIRYNLPVGKQEGSCMIEAAVDNGPAQHLQEHVPHPVSEGTFGPIFLGALSSHWEMSGNSANGARRFMGCIREFWVNSKEIYLVGESATGRNIMNCEPLVCQLLPCRNGGTCVSSDEDWFCECPPQYTGRLCQLSACERSPCAYGATCIPKSPLEAVCLCPFGRQGLLCDHVVNITRPRFGGNDEFGYTSFLAYTSVPSLAFFYEFKLKFILANNSSAVKDNLILFAGYKGQGNQGDDFLALGIKSGRVVHRFNLGSGVATIVSDRLDPSIPIHTVAFGRAKRTGWLQVDGQRNRTGSSRGPLVGLGVFHQLFVGGYNEYTPELLPLSSRFRHGFQGCLFDVQFRTGRDRKFQELGQPEGQPPFGRSVGQCGVTPCAHVSCENGGTCMDSGSSVYCQCPLGWKGALCSETVSVCDEEHSPSPLCAHGSTCIALPNGYTCHCPLGTAGLYCDKAVTITDPFFSGNQSSWMSFAPLSVRHKTVLELQFQPLTADGILVYIAQHLNPRAGDFLCLSLTLGHVQLRYNLGDGTHVLRSTNRVDPSGTAWHRVRAGRVGLKGFLSLDNKDVDTNDTSTQRMSTLDVSTDLFVGGVSSLSAVAPDATEGAPMGFTGGLRELIVNGRDLDLSERGAVSGANVGDWDGTACGYKVCQNRGRCRPTGTDSFMCICPPDWTGFTCNQSVGCVNHKCKHGSFCSASNASSYHCSCPLGWTGSFCDTFMSTGIFQFMGNSFIKYTDTRHSSRNLKHSQFSLSFLTNTNDSLIMWMGRAEREDEDYLAIGLEKGHIKIAVNLGERLPQPLSYENMTLCCNRWHNLSLSLNATVLQVWINDHRVIFKNIDPFERYVALNYGGTIYFGGFELDRSISIVTSGLFAKGFEGRLSNVYLYNDSKPLQFLPDSEGFNVYDGNK